MKYLADTWLLQNDIFETNEHPAVSMNKAKNVGLQVNEKLLAFYNGQKDHLIRFMALNNGINKVFQTDKEKYKKIWAGNDPRYPTKRRIPLSITDGNQVQPQQTKQPNYIT